MAVVPTELFDGPITVGAQKRICATWTQAKTFAAGSGTIAKGTPLGVVSASKDWGEWDADSGAGLATFRGIAWPNDIVLDAGGEVIGNVMLAGKAHIDDMVLPGNETLTTLKAALITAARDVNIQIEGYHEIH